MLECHHDSIALFMSLSFDQQRYILSLLNNFGSSLSNFFMTVLQNLVHVHLEALQMLSKHVPSILNILVKYKDCYVPTLYWAHDTVSNEYMTQFLKLIKKTAGWHFGAANAHSSQLETFNLAEMAQKMSTLAPDLWTIIGQLIAEDPIANNAREAQRHAQEAKAREKKNYRATVGSDTDDLMDGPENGNDSDNLDYY